MHTLCVLSRVSFLLALAGSSHSLTTRTIPNSNEGPGMTLYDAARLVIKGFPNHLHLLRWQPGFDSCHRHKQKSGQKNQMVFSLSA